ncbi:delta 9-fatty acid desaturase protein [Heliocybe sulcata]|uniref:Acyl-CoA desaturase n=1 Tax=Heliocybe sulcata TaxID=5364 RepID=A0A5C3NHF8_9AGAM|nr:delta 9-fatty acid desaturase protein [Heliocybe sulcata]
MISMSYDPDATRLQIHRCIKASLAMRTVSSSTDGIASTPEHACSNGLQQHRRRRSVGALRPPAITLSKPRKEIRWFSLAVLLLTPMAAVYGSFTTPLTHKTCVFAMLYYIFNMLGITAGYHRLWSHRSYSASIPLQCFLACAGSGAVQGSIRFWARLHRAHHRYTDTALDPYSAHLGFWHSHFGWMLVKPRVKPGPAECGDLRKNRVVAWQHRWYFPLAAFWGLLIPVAFCGLVWEDWWGGWYWAGFARLVVVHHSTFAVNSVAHWLGSTPYSDGHSPRDHLVTALLTLGEGYHNFHHQFPSDYRNAIRWYQYDPTKWFISCCAFFGLASSLQRFRESEIQKCRLTMSLKKLKYVQDEIEEKWGWGVPAETLEIWSWEKFIEASSSRPLMAISGFVHDISSFTQEHPGGEAYLKAYVAKDATSAFYGGLYDHSDAAVNLLATLRTAILSHGVEIVTDTASAEDPQDAPCSAGEEDFTTGVPPCRKLQIVQVRN